MVDSKVLRTVALALICAHVCIAQTQQTFEVASVRVSHEKSDDGYWSIPGTGSFTAHNLSLERLIMLAYGVDANQIDNKPGWLESDHFDVSAKPAGDVALSREELKPLLQSLLRERFHLDTHIEVRPMPGYALTVAKGGPKLQPTKGSRFPGYRLSVTDKELSGLNWTMPFLAGMLQHAAGKPVVDKTGLSGSYDVTLTFSPDLSGDDSLPNVFTALQQTLGLKLEAQRIPVEVLVIDRVDRTPAEN